jgi:hypothetical protein
MATGTEHILRLVVGRDKPEALIVGEGYRSLAEGAKVSYEVEAGEKGLRAVNLQLVSSDPARLSSVSGGHARALIDNRTRVAGRLPWGRGRSPGNSPRGGV